jgi:predicted nucleotidyltransferase
VAERVPQSLLAALADLAAWLDDTRVPSMIIGGVAASVLGRPRLTQDVDALVILPDDQWQGMMENAVRFGIFPRIEAALEFARRSRVLLMRHRASGVDLDITFGGLQFELAAIELSVMHSVGGVSVRLPRVEDLLVMKAVARRPKDTEDMRGLLAAHPEVDVAEVRRWVQEFAAATGMPDMLVELDRLTGKEGPADHEV